MAVSGKEDSHVETVMKQLEQLFEEALKATFPDEAPVVATCRNPNFGDYQCNNANSVWSKIKGKGTQFSSPEDVGKAIVKNLPATEMIESCNVAKSGFVNIVLSKNWMAKNILKMLADGVDVWAPRLGVKRVVVDFSSPNIAKEMHVGHLRSTIIGDTIARMLEFSKVEVLRRNHVGDWGTQFGMLIEYLFENADADAAGEQDIGDLQAFYRKSKEKFDSDPEFKERAQKAVVSLQGGVERYQTAWAKICEISRKGFEEVYQRLGVKLEEKGESFYNPSIPAVLKELDNKGLIKEDQGARVIFIEGKEVPFIVVKSDGGFNYASTDLTAMWYRLNVEKAEWIIYVTDVGQTEHFENLFTSAKCAGWLPAGDNVFPKATHVGFGLVLGEDGKRFRTRSTEVVRLVDLLDEAKNRCKKTLESRGKNTDDRTAEAIGYGAVKYADLKNKRLTNYTFDFDQMLNDKGDTAVYLLYAYARICSIINKSGENIQELKKKGTIGLGEPVEHALALRLLQFAEAVEEACTSLFPHKLCEYLYKLSEDFNKFYTKCHVNGSTVPQSTQQSRLLLCEATAVVMRKCFYLLGITPVDKI